MVVVVVVCLARVPGEPLFIAIQLSYFATARLLHKGEIIRLTLLPTDAETQNRPDTYPTQHMTICKNLATWRPRQTLLKTITKNPGLDTLYFLLNKWITALIFSAKIS